MFYFFSEDDLVKWLCMRNTNLNTKPEFVRVCASSVTVAGPAGGLVSVRTGRCKGEEDLVDVLGFWLVQGFRV